MLRSHSSLPSFLNFTLTVLLPWPVGIRTDSLQPEYRPLTGPSKLDKSQCKAPSNLRTKQ
jgi:hypothetical protein